MRRRRLGRSLLRADLAIEDGNIEEARAAIAEAREIAGESAEVVELDNRLRDLEAPPPLPRRQLSGGWRLLAAGACLLLIAGFTGARSWIGVWLSEDSTPGVALVQGGVSTPVAPSADAAPSESRTALQVIQETISARAMMPKILLQDDDDAELPPRPAPPIASSRPNATVEAPARPPALAPPVQTEARTSAGEPLTTAPPRPEIRPAPDTSSQVTAPPPPERSIDPAPSTVTTSSVARPDPAVARPDPAPPAPVSAARAVPPAPEPGAAPAADESLGVRAVLQRYAVAYSRLDAAAASAVWPAVDRSALERAFGGLLSQQVSLGECDVSVQGSAARATCAGTATWEPKVGGRARTEPRQWNFELRKAGDAWRIERAITRGGD